MPADSITLDSTPAISSVGLDLDLIRKYSIPGPRYTSYPPATKFSSDFDEQCVADAIARDNEQGSPLSLYFHLPFCESRCWFCGCNTVITRQHGLAAPYLDDLERELALMAARLNTSRRVAQIHLGGGTPTFLRPDELRRLGDIVHRVFPNFASDAEFSVEIDPRRLSLDQVTALSEIGANRASLGIQDTDPRVQLAIHRIQPQEKNQQAVDWLSLAGFSSINVDLIYGLPLQTPESFAKTIDDVLGFSPDRLSVFSYAHVPWIKPAQKIFDDRNQLPSPEEKLRMFAVAHEKLVSSGYVDIGLDHFARPDDELAIAQRENSLHRNFQGYTTRAGTSLYAFGMSSISATQDAYWQNDKTLDGWRSALRDGKIPVDRGLRLTDEDRRRRTIIMRLMCDRRLNFQQLSNSLGLDFESNYHSELSSLEDLITDGIVMLDENGLQVTQLGVPLLRVVAMRFDATLRVDSTSHSKTI